MPYPPLGYLQVFIFLLYPDTFPPYIVSSYGSCARADEWIEDNLPFSSYELNEIFEKLYGFYCGMVVCSWSILAMPADALFY